MKHGAIQTEKMPWDWSVDSVILRELQPFRQAVFRETATWGKSAPVRNALI